MESPSSKLVSVKSTMAKVKPREWLMMTLPPALSVAYIGSFCQDPGVRVSLFFAIRSLKNTPTVGLVYLFSKYGVPDFCCPIGET